jgi:hypothetical protein
MRNRSHGIPAFDLKAKLGKQPLAIGAGNSSVILSEALNQTVVLRVASDCAQKSLWFCLSVEAQGLQPCENQIRPRPGISLDGLIQIA